ncbi:GumC family protein [Pontibacter beigongshangensis]|uniref:GumC family protein n=1 Tax=Pontibacter beigongshangensis TaxID=2574733 RepID=UPI00164EF904|nr:polysaccharide biosynthesis tyrosine autokinase [Pontibacter beigongshangensis]
MKRNTKEHEIDIKSWLFKFKNKWYLFLAFALISLAAAYVFVKSSNSLYEFKATLLLGDQQTGSRKAQELLNILDVPSKGIKVEDEIGLLKSAEMVKRALQRLDFSVAYYKVTDHWLNTFGELVVQEQYNEAPYIVKLDTSSTQLVDIPIEIKVLNDKQYQITIEAEDVKRYDFRTHSSSGLVPAISLVKVHYFGEPYKDDNLSFTLLRDSSTTDISGKKHYFVVNSMKSQVARQQSKLEVSPIDRDSRVLELKSKGSIPEKELAFLNTLMDEYVAKDLEEKNLNGHKTIEFIDSQLATLTDSLRKSKQAISSFRSANKISNISNQTSINSQQLSQLQTERARLMVDKQNYESLLEQFSGEDALAQAVSPAAAAGIQNAVLSSLFGQLTELNREKAGYRVTATQDNPKLQVLEGKIENTRHAIIANLKNVISSTNNNLKDINRRMGEIESTLARLPESERVLADLQSEAEFVDKKYGYLLEKRAEASIALATNTTDKKVIDRASLASSGPVNVKPKMIYMLALIIGLIIPAAMIVLISNVDNTIQGKNDLAKVTNIPFLGVIAHGSRNDKLAVKNNPRSAIAESFRSIRINLQYLMAEQGFKVIGITSSVSGEGKTFTSVNLSTELAMAGKRTVLIESDMRKPTFSKYFNNEAAAGLSSYLTDGAALEDVVQKTEIENLDIISSGPIPDNAIQLLERPRMRELIEVLKEKYDHIVIDTPPIGFVSEYFILMKHMDTNLYVVKHRFTNKDMLQQINELYANKKIKNIHMVINDLDYGKTYEYGYKKKATYYYV